MRYLPRSLSILLVSVWVAISFTAGSPVTAANSITVPTGFVDEAVYSGLLAPRAFTFMPDGRVLALERGSASSTSENIASIRVFKNGALLPTRAYTLNVCGDTERGLLGVAVDPNFIANGYIYIYYTRQASSGPICDHNTFKNGIDGGPRNRISRLTMSGDVVIVGSERILIDSIASDGGNHNGGDLHFGPDGYLYASTGDGGNNPNLSPNSATLNGKMLRILPTSGVAGGYSTIGNPYESVSGSHNCATAISIHNSTLAGSCKEIFAKGFRNPFRFIIQPSMAGIPGTGSPFVGDAGQVTWEEVDQVHSGGDYGWPIREGFCIQGALCTPPYQSGGYDNPLYAYSHQVGSSSVSSVIIGGDFYLGGASYPPQYLNNYFFADYNRRFIGRLVYNSATGWTHPAQDFATNVSGPIGLQRGPDGNLYYLTFTSTTDRVDGIRRIRYINSLNKPPTAHASVDITSGPLSATYTFSAEGSADPDNNLPLTYNWDFGDGTSDSTQNLTTTHVYNTAVNVVATLVVSDSLAATSVPATLVLYPGNTPPSGDIVLANQTDGSRTTTYYAGDTWAYSAANLTDNNPLPADALLWEVDFHHQGHIDPLGPLVQADNGTFTIPRTGDLDPAVFYRVHLYITDARGQRTEMTQDLQPVTSDLTFTTSPTSGRVIIQGVSLPTPLTITRVVGMQFSLNVLSPQSIWGASYTFNNWSQGGSPAQTITVPSTDTTYKATFNPPINAAPPKNYFTTHTPTLTWNRVTTAVRYMLQVGTNAGFTGATVYQVGNNLSFTLPTSLPDGFYYWRVAACTSATACNSWSATDTFVVDAP